MDIEKRLEEIEVSDADITFSEHGGFSYRNRLPEPTELLRQRRFLLSELRKHMKEMDDALIAMRKRAALMAQKVGVEFDEPAIGFAIAERIRTLANITTQDEANG